MNRLQKKCLIATISLHLLLVLTVLFGAGFMGFFKKAPKPDETHILTAIPANLIDKAMESGAASAQPPPPAPVQPPQPPQPRPEPPQPKPEPPQPQKTLVETVKEIFKPEPKKELPPEDIKPVENGEIPTKPAPKKIKVDLTPVVRKTPVSRPDKSDSEEEARETKRLQDQRRKAFSSAMSSISKNSSTSTEVSMPGASPEAYANYKDALATLYYEAWTPPNDTSNDDAITKVRIVIARDGTVISARIIGPSGDARVDASVQRAIDRVSQVPPLPEGSKENQRTVVLNFNLKTKRLIG